MPRARSKKKIIEEHMALPYSLELIADGKGAWIARVPELPGCHAIDERPDVAIHKLIGVREAWILNAVARGAHIPPPRMADNL